MLQKRSGKTPILQLAFTPHKPTDEDGAGKRHEHKDVIVSRAEPRPEEGEHGHQHDGQHQP